MKKKRTLSTILLILLIIAFLASGGYLFHYFWMAKKQTKMSCHNCRNKAGSIFGCQEETEVKSKPVGRFKRDIGPS